MLHPGTGARQHRCRIFVRAQPVHPPGCVVWRWARRAAGNGARLTKVSGQTPPGNSCWTPRRRAAVAPPRQRCQIILRREELVGTSRFELLTPRTPSECSTRLSHVPTLVRAGTGVPRRVVSVYRTDLLQPRPCRPMAPQSHSGSGERRSRHAPHDQLTPAAEASVRATQCRASGRSEAQSLDGRRSAGYFGHQRPGPVFSASSRTVTATFTRRNREHADSPPTASFHTRSLTATCKRQHFRALWP